MYELVAISLNYSDFIVIKLIIIISLLLLITATLTLMIELLSEFLVLVREGTALSLVERSQLFTTLSSINSRQRRQTTIGHTLLSIQPLVLLFLQRLLVVILVDQRDIRIAEGATGRLETSLSAHDGPSGLTQLRNMTLFRRQPV